LKKILAQFVQAFRKLMRVDECIAIYTDFDWEDLLIEEQELKTIKAST
jgi:hypothetical protein